MHFVSLLPHSYHSPVSTCSIAADCTCSLCVACTHHSARAAGRAPRLCGCSCSCSCCHIYAGPQLNTPSLHVCIPLALCHTLMTHCSAHMQLVGPRTCRIWHIALCVSRALTCGILHMQFFTRYSAHAVGTILQRCGCSCSWSCRHRCLTVSGQLHVCRPFTLLMAHHSAHAAGMAPQRHGCSCSVSAHSAHAVLALTIQRMQLAGPSTVWL
jgi:hypothetical protein